MRNFRRFSWVKLTNGKLSFDQILRNLFIQRNMLLEAIPRTFRAIMAGIQELQNVLKLSLFCHRWISSALRVVTVATTILNTWQY